MSATLAPTIWDLAKDKFNSVAKRRRVPEDPKWSFPKVASVVAVVGSLSRMLDNLPFFLVQPDPTSIVSVAFSAKAAFDATVNCVKTFRAARQSALYIDDPLESKPTLTPSESISKSALAIAFSHASCIPNDLGAGAGGSAAGHAAWAALFYGVYRLQKGPRGPGE